MSIQFSSDFNQFFNNCLNQFSDAKRKFKLELTKLNKIINTNYNKLFSYEISAKVNDICAKLGIYLSDIQSFGKYKFAGGNIKRNSISIFLDWYNEIVEYGTWRNIKHYQYLRKDLERINNLTQYFEFNNEKIMKLYRKYVGDAIGDNVRREIKKNKRIKAAIIGSIIGGIFGPVFATIISIIFS